MVPSIPSRRTAAALLVVALFVVGLAQPSVNDLPGFSDHTGPTELEVTAFERVEAGCADAVATRARRTTGGGGYERLAFVRTGSADADLSARVERTSPRGADLSTFRVHVDAHPQPPALDPANGTCAVGVLYRIRLNASGGSPEGFLPDAHGTRVLWLENGGYAGCSASVTSPLDAECDRFVATTPTRTWANAS